MWGHLNVVSYRSNKTPISMKPEMKFKQSSFERIIVEKTCITY